MLNSTKANIPALFIEYFTIFTGFILKCLALWKQLKDCLIPARVASLSISDIYITVSHLPF